MQASLIQYNGVAVPANSTPQGNAVPIYDSDGALATNGLTSVGKPVITPTVQLAAAAVSATGTVAVTTTTERVDATAGAITRTLQPAATVPGQIVAVKKIDSSGNLVTVKGDSAELIDGANTYTGLSAQWKSVILHSNGTSWDILAVK